MTLNELKLLHAFNSWADNRVFDALEQLTDDQYRQEMKSSHGSIHGTMTHIVAAQKLWLSRWAGKPDTSVLRPTDAGSLKELRGIWERVGYETARFLGTMNDRRLQEPITYTTTDGKTHTTILWQTIQHVVDHSTYHRGQVITLMRQLGVKPPGTGMIAFYRESSTVR